MSRPAVIASVFVATAAVFALGGTAYAANPPSPPPIAANTQPVTVTSDAQGQPAVAHCGASASAGDNNYSSSPNQISSSGTSSPSGCGATAGAPNAGGAGQTAGAGGSGSTGTNAAPERQSSTGNATNADLFPGALPHSSGGFAWGPLWLGLLLLLALFAMLVGFAIGRRRPANARA